MSATRRASPASSMVQQPRALSRRVAAFWLSARCTPTTSCPASRMLDAGHEVVGVHLALSQNAATLRESARGCCTIEDAGDARRVADMLGIPFYVWDMAARFTHD